MKHLLIAFPLLVAGPAAYAADAIVEPMPMEVAPVVSYGWGGLYFGGQIGAGFGDTGVFEMDRNQDGSFGDYIAAFDPTQPVCTIPVNDGCGFGGDFDTGVTGGVHIGYDWQFGSIVAGVIADVNASNIGDRQSAFSGTPAFYHIDRDLEWWGTARARLGYAFSDRFMGYATGGLALGKVDYSFKSNTPATTIVSGDDNLDVGYTVGGGAEFRINEKWSIGAEYLYTNLGKDDFNVNLSGAPGSGAGNAFGTGGADSTNARGSDRDFDFHTVQVKLSYRY